MYRFFIAMIMLCNKQHCSLGNVYTNSFAHRLAGDFCRLGGSQLGLLVRAGELARGWLVWDGLTPMFSSWLAIGWGDGGD